MLATLAFVVSTTVFYDVVDTGLRFRPGDERTLEGGCADMNDLRQVVCTEGLSDGNSGFIWQDGKITKVTSPTGGIVEFSSINNNGVAVGTMQLTYWLSDASFIWDAEQGLRQINDGGQQFQAGDINDDGLVGGTWFDSNREVYVMGTWKDGTLTMKMDLPCFGYATGVNKVGELVGTTGGAGPQAYRFGPTQGGYVLPRGIAPTGIEPFDCYTDVSAINDDGWACGWVMAPHDPAHIVRGRGTIWLPNNTRIDVGPNVGLLDINNDNVAVGRRSPLASPSRLPGEAVIWEQRYGLVDLNTVVPPLTPWLTRAVAINQRGEILCESPSLDGLISYLILKPLRG